MKILIAFGGMSGDKKKGEAWVAKVARVQPQKILLVCQPTTKSSTRTVAKQEPASILVLSIFLLH